MMKRSLFALAVALLVLLGLPSGLASCSSGESVSIGPEPVEAGATPCPIYACPGGEPGSWHACPQGDDPYADAGLPCDATGCVCDPVHDPTKHHCEEVMQPAPTGKAWVPWCSACGRTDLAKRAAMGEFIPDSAWLPPAPAHCEPYPPVQADAGSGEFILGCCLVDKAIPPAPKPPHTPTGARRRRVH